jgi:ribose transport system ATP-binding protein
MEVRVVQVHSLTKRFADVVALDSVDFTAHPGELTGLAGASGAGKSTLCAVLAGHVRPDSGTVDVDSRHVALIDGEPVLAGNLAVAENLWLGIEPRTRLGRVDRGEMDRRTRYVLARLDIRVDPWMAAGSLTPALRKVVEIARALAVGARVIVLDEPAALMNAAQAEVLLVEARRLTFPGLVVIYASQEVCELARVAHRVTVLRSGRSSALQAVCRNR